MTPESKVKKEIIAYLDSLGDRCWHVSYHNIGYGVAGVPDRIACYRGRFVALEVKADSEKKATKWQKYRIKEITTAGGTAHVVWSVGQVRRIIQDLETEITWADATLQEALERCGPQ